MNETANLTTYRNSDLRVTYSFPKGYDLGGFSAIFYLRASAGATPLLTLSSTPTVNGSTAAIVGLSVVLTLKKADLQLLPSEDVWVGVYDSTLTKDSFVNRFAGGSLTQYIDGSYGDQEFSDSIFVEVNGQQNPIIIQGGNLGIGASVLLSDLNAAVEASSESANDAAASAAEAAATVANKADISGANIANPAAFRGNIGVDLGLRFTAPTFPGGFATQAFAGMRTDTRFVSGTASQGFQALAVGGTLAPTTIANFRATPNPDANAVSGWVLRGAGATNSVVAGNFGAWWENYVPGALIWAVEIDANNEAGTRPLDSDDGGMALAINTGSTYSPDSAIYVRRFAGAGSAPGFLRGMKIAGARQIGLEIEAMSPVTYPSMTPAASGTITALKVQVSNDTQARFLMDESGSMSWGSGMAAQDVTLYRGLASLNLSGSLNLLTSYSLKVNGNQVVGAQGAAVADAVPAAGDPTQAEFNALVTQFNALLSRVRAGTGHGLIAP